MAVEKRATPRVREHVDKLREAGLDTQKFFDALSAIRDDSALPRPHREALYKLIAMESFIWYLEAIRGERIDRIKLREEVNKLGEEYAAAIRKREPGDEAAALAEKNISAPPPAITASERRPPPPRKKSAAPRKAPSRATTKTDRPKNK